MERQQTSYRVVKEKVFGMKGFTYDEFDEEFWNTLNPILLGC